MNYRQRLEKIEATLRRRHGPPHHISVASYPWDLPYGDQEHWIREALPCACGELGCALMTIGVLVPEQAPSAEAWGERAYGYYAQRRAHDA